MGLERDVFKYTRKAKWRNWICHRVHNPKFKVRVLVSLIEEYE